MPHFKDRVTKQLTTRREQGLTRQLVPKLAGNQVILEQGGHRYVNFSSNDYLGLANEAMLVRAWQQGLTLFGCGSAASPMVTGYSPAHQELSEQLCDWLGYDSAVLFNSGFSANQALLMTLLRAGDYCLQDKLNHASLIEASLATPAKLLRFRHNDMSHLGQLLAKTEHAPTLLITEGVFSMDGDRAPLAKMAQQCQDHDEVVTVLDDAHGIGVIGEKGKGSAHLAGVRPDFLVVTFGKAFGLSGAAILCDRTYGDYLTQFAKHHVYSTAIPPAQAYALTQALEIIQNQDWRRDKLQTLCQIYDQHLNSEPGYVYTETAIKPFVIADLSRLQTMVNALQQQGFWVSAIRPPTVPSGTSRLRITLTANHSREQVLALVSCLKQHNLTK